MGAAACSGTRPAGPLGADDSFGSQSESEVTSCHPIEKSGETYVFVRALGVFPERHPGGDYTFARVLYEEGDDVVDSFDVLVRGDDTHPGVTHILGSTPDGFGVPYEWGTLPAPYELEDGNAAVGVILSFSGDGEANPAGPAITISGVEYQDADSKTFVIPTSRRTWVSRLPVDHPDFCSSYYAAIEDEA